MPSSPVRPPRQRRIGILLPLALAASMVTVGAAQAQSAVEPSPAAVDDARLTPDQIEVGSELLATTGARLSAIGTPDDGSGRMFVVDKAGRILVFHPDTQSFDPQPLLNITDRVSTAGNERGLLGVAPSPDFARTHTLFVSYTALGTGVENGALTLSRFVLDSADQATIDPSTEERVLRQQHNLNSNHNGGNLMFGPDGFLYWSTGDGGSADDPLYGAQNLSVLLGKIIRIDAMRECDGHLYCIPPNNPFAHTSFARPEIWAYGLRNPWRFSFDAEDNSMWIGDVGQNRWEEVNNLPLEPRKDDRNFGWSCREGFDVHRQPESAGDSPDPFLDVRCLPGARYIDPVFSYSIGADAPECAVMGGFVYRGEEFADIADGTYVATDYCSGAAYAIQKRHNEYLINDAAGVLPEDLPGRVNSFGVDSNGEIYFVTDTVSPGLGAIYRLTFAKASTS
jgi:glucose/arabinose dehydrogenase